MIICTNKGGIFMVETDKEPGKLIERYYHPENYMISMKRIGRETVGLKTDSNGNHYYEYDCTPKGGLCDGCAYL